MGLYSLSPLHVEQKKELNIKRNKKVVMTKPNPIGEEKRAARERLDRLFEVALVLIGVLAAAELQFITAKPFPTGLQAIQDIIWLLNLGLATFPFLVLIPSWMIRELLKIRGSFRWSISLTFFCWDFWGVLLFIYLVNLIGQFEFLPLIPILTFAGSAILFTVVVISWLYKETASDQENVLYFKKIRWQAEVALWVAISLIIMALIILGLAFPAFSNLSTQEALGVSSSMIE